MRNCHRHEYRVLSPFVTKSNGEPRGSRTSLADKQIIRSVSEYIVLTDELKRAKQKMFILKNKYMKHTFTTMFLSWICILILVLARVFKIILPPYHNIIDTLIVVLTICSGVLMHIFWTECRKKKSI